VQKNAPFALYKGDTAHVGFL